MNIGQAIVPGVVEGLTEFLPVSSTAHLLIVERLLGPPMGTQEQKDSLIGFTAVIQTGAIVAAVLAFLKDILRLGTSFFGGLASVPKRAERDIGFALALALVVGSLPIAFVGLAFKDVIKSIDEQLISVAIGLIVFSAVLVFAEKRTTQDREERSLTVKDALLIGLAQCIALVPGWFAYRRQQHLVPGAAGRRARQRARNRPLDPGRSDRGVADQRGGLRPRVLGDRPRRPAGQGGCAARSAVPGPVVPAGRGCTGRLTGGVGAAVRGLPVRVGDGVDRLQPHRHAPDRPGEAADGRAGTDLTAHDRPRGRPCREHPRHLTGSLRPQNSGS